VTTGNSVGKAGNSVNFAIFACPVGNLSLNMLTLIGYKGVEMRMNYYDDDDDEGGWGEDEDEDEE